MAKTQPQLHLPTPNTTRGLSYGEKVIATTKYHWIDIKSKNFNGDLSIRIVKDLNKKL
jgi:hypothetical protein